MEFHRLFKGPQAGLEAIPKKRGYIYFCTDTGNAYVDVASDTTSAVDGSFIPGKRVQVNAGAAKYLINSNGDYVDVDNIITGDTQIGVSGGGTGCKELEAGAVLVGNGTDPITTVSGIGVLYCTEDGGLQFGTLPLELGGTGGTSADELLESLDVYTTEEVTNLLTDLQTSIIQLLTDKQDKISGQPGQFVTIDEEGNAVPQAVTMVNTFKGRSGAVLPQTGDYNAAMVGARPSDWMPTAQEVGAATEAYVQQYVKSYVDAAIQEAIIASWGASY